MSQLTTIFGKASKLVQRNSTVILSSVAVAGVVSTAVAAVKATPEAIRRIEERYVYDNQDEVASTKEIIKLVWTLYLPAAGIGAATIVCILGAQKIKTKRNAALAGMYTLSETVFKEYQEKVAEQIGKGQEQKVRDAVAQDQVTNNPVNDREVIIVSGSNQLFRETISGRYFESDVESVKRAQNELNSEAIAHDYASHNDFYRSLGLPAIDAGEELGWTVDNQLEVTISAAITEDGRSCLSIGYVRRPIANYWKRH